MPNSTQKDQSYIEKILNKAASVVLPNVTTGGAGQSHRNVQGHMNALDDINKQLDNTSTQDTPKIQQIFEK